jgi:capsular polysaccharide biosynthesis protein
VHGWHVPSSPVPHDEVGLEVVEDAHLTPVRRGELRSLRGPARRWISGAVHDREGRLVPRSQKTVNGGPWAQADPDTVGPSPDARRLPGTWLYGGHWMGHFGHFFTETLTTLWPRDVTVDGCVFHAFSNPREPKREWQLELLRLAGFDLPVRIVREEPLRVERLLLPSRTVVLDGGIHPAATTVWDRMAANATARTGRGHADRVFFSRAAFHTQELGRARPVRRSSEQWDVSVDEAFAAAGFEVVHPEKLPLAEQISLAAGADVIAGNSGSALHLAAFASAGRRVVEVGDARSPRKPLTMQVLINSVRQHEQAHIGYAEPALSPEVLGRLGL